VDLGGGGEEELKEEKKEATCCAGCANVWYIGSLFLEIRGCWETLRPVVAILRKLIKRGETMENSSDWQKDER